LDWPGNVREPENVIGRALILSHGPALAVGEALGRASVPRARTAPARAATKGSPPDLALTLAQSERAHILRACEASG
jgi:DNA-binding NtrC family response regulator